MKESLITNALSGLKALERVEQSYQAKPVFIPTSMTKKVPETQQEIDDMIAQYLRGKSDE